MALNFCDGFDSYAATADLTKKWRTAAVPWTWVANAGRFGAGAVVSTGSVGGGQLATQLNIPGPGYGPSWLQWGFHFKASAPPSSTQLLFGVYTSGAVLSLDMRIDNTGRIVFYVAGAALGSPVGVFNICDGAWHWIELQVQGRTGQAFWDLYVDAIHCGSIQGGLQGSFLTGYYAFNSIPSITMTIDDLVCWDSTGSSFNGFPLGPRLITTLRPTSDGVCNFATLSAGTTHFNLINEVNPDGDTSYVEDGTSGHQDLLNFPGLGYIPTDISCAVVNAYMKTGVIGTINNQMVCKSGATTAASASATTASTYITQQQGFGADPNTSAAWTLAGLTAAQFGYKNP